MGTFFPTTKTSKIHRFFNSLRCLAEMGEWHVERGALLKNVTQPFWIHVWYTPRKINGWNLKITQLKRKIIYKKPSFSGSMLFFQGVFTHVWLFFNGKYIGRYTQSHGSCGTCFIAGTSGSTNPVVFVHCPVGPLCLCFRSKVAPVDMERMIFC